MTQGMKEEPNWQMGTDNMILSHMYNKTFNVNFLTKVIGKADFDPSGKRD
jgi:hypothetical protein